MDTRVYIYYVFLLSCFVIAFFNRKNEKGLNILFLLLLLSVITEAIVFVMHFRQLHGSNHYIVYHIFSPIEYSLTAWYYRSVSQSRLIRRGLVVSIFFFCIVSVLISTEVINTSSYPSLNNQISYVLTICFSMIILLNIPAQAHQQLVHKAVFWVAIGFIVYCTGVFFFNSLYNHLQLKQKTLAKDRFNLLNSIFNDILYTLIATGFLCSKTRKSKPLLSTAPLPASS